MKKLFLSTLLLAAVLATSAQEATDLVSFLKSNKKVIIRAHRASREFCISADQCLKPVPTGLSPNYLFLADSLGPEILFGFGCNKYIKRDWGYVSGLIYVYYCDPDPQKPIWLFYANKNLKGIFLVEDSEQGTVEVPVLCGRFSRMSNQQIEQFIAIIKAWVKVFGDN